MFRNISDSSASSESTGQRLQFKNATRINIVPRTGNLASNSTSGRTASDVSQPQQSTKVVITTIRDQTPSQVVLNFPVDAGT